MDRFHAKISYDAARIKQLAQVTYNTFHLGQKIAMTAGGVLLVLLGLWGKLGSTAASGLCLMAGCWIFVSRNYPARRMAEQTTRAVNGQFPTMTYDFFGETFSADAGKDHNVVRYRDLVRLVDDGTFFYLFINEQSAYMVQKSTVEPDLEQFQTHVAAACGKKWTSSVSLFKLNLRSLFALAPRRKK